MHKTGQKMIQKCDCQFINKMKIEKFNLPKRIFICNLRKLRVTDKHRKHFEETFSTSNKYSIQKIQENLCNLKGKPLSNP